MKRAQRKRVLPGQLQLLFDPAQEAYTYALGDTLANGSTALSSSDVAEPAAPAQVFGLNRFDYHLAVRNGSSICFRRHILLKVLNWILGSGIGVGFFYKMPDVIEWFLK